MSSVNEPETTNTVEVAPVAKNYEFGINTDEMNQAGVNFGHKKAFLHPKMKPFVQGMKNNVVSINLEKTAEKLVEALNFLRAAIMERKTILFVGTKVQARDIVKALAIEFDFPYITGRWVGGTFTNFGMIKKRVSQLLELEAKKASGELEKYTKKEQAKFLKKINALEEKFGGIRKLDRIPDVIFVADMKKDHNAISEARKKGVKIIAICDANANPDLIDYPIPANDDAVSSAEYIFNRVKDAISSVKSSK